MNPTLSIVIGCSNAASTIEACLNAVSRDRSGVEVILVDSSTDGSAEKVAGRFPAVTVMRMAPGLLVPFLWSTGIGLSKGAHIAITTAHCVPEDDWVERCLFVAQSSEAAVGGPILEPLDGSATDWAIYLARYSAFLPPLQEGKTAEIAGDNAVYRRDLLQTHHTTSEGFWEHLYHRSLRLDGYTLSLDPKLAVRFAGSSFTEFCSVRARHGFHYGSTREMAFPERVIRFVTSPLLPPVLVLRIVRRVVSKRRDWTRNVARALPFLFIAVLSWSLGEAAGYLRPGSQSRTQ